MPDAHDPSERHAPMMLTTDLALRMDPIYEPISRRFHENPDQLAEAFAKAWYKLTAPGHGPGVALPRPRGPPSRSCLAGSGPRGRPRARSTHDDVAALEGEAPRLGSVGPPAGVHRMGVGVVVPRHRQARRRQRRAHPPGTAEGLGGQRADRAGRGARHARGDQGGLQRRRSPATSGSRSPT
ncbi:MAG: hypothetical protein U5R31_14945 [Acidimicrobiia bacterium]|nr:hypothetical protein [Acidimicrobiia bacterium]